MARFWPSMSSPANATSELPSSLPDALRALEAERERNVELTRERDHLRASHERLRLELEASRRSCRHELPSVQSIAAHSQYPFSSRVFGC